MVAALELYSSLVRTASCRSAYDGPQWTYLWVSVNCPRSYPCDVSIVLSCNCSMTQYKPSQLWTQFMCFMHVQLSLLFVRNCL